ncbi:ABC transporter substrate-binding protein [Chryseobacterium sp. MP_3.2]|uniref:ABC transporter substrate-binding protein n=1 Tax=Chryseobacterium sp. MP_3.2 TaxID=3071712 RepID=UPI002E0924F2|nr:ABC-type Fe3+-hydroxamate transport system substrate-binding protein [Chryseobacterium sp. MP_3.2]
MKIVSLVPSITETLFDFGLTGNDVIGRTKFCIHPENLVKNVPIIGGTKNLNIEKIIALKPDLIIANKEENEKLQVEELMKHSEVWVTDIKTLEDNSKFIFEVGELLHQKEKAAQFNKIIDSIFQNSSSLQPKKAAYLIWKNPYMTIGSDTFIHDVLEKIGVENIAKNQLRYPEISLEEMSGADFILLSSEPFPFQNKHIKELQEQLPHSKIILVDGEAFSWFGTHISKCANNYQKLKTEIFA